PAVRAAPRIIWGSSAWPAVTSNVAGQLSELVAPLPASAGALAGRPPPRYYFVFRNIVAVPWFMEKNANGIVSQFRSLLWLFVSCFLSTSASAGSERLTVAYPQWPPYKVVQNGAIGGIDALVLDEIAPRTRLEL